MLHTMKGNMKGGGIICTVHKMTGSMQCRRKVCGISLQVSCGVWFTWQLQTWHNSRCNIPCKKRDRRTCIVYRLKQLYHSCIAPADLKCWASTSSGTTARGYDLYLLSFIRLRVKIERSVAPCHVVKHAMSAFYYCLGFKQYEKKGISIKYE